MNTNFDAQEIIGVAQQLAGLVPPPLTPSQTHLRESIACSYQALFHELISAAQVRTGESNPATPMEKNMVNRNPHNQIRSVCQWVTKSTSDSKLPKRISDLIGQPSAELADISAAFISLQDARHTAVYDLAVSYTPITVKSLIRVSKNAISLISKLQGDRIFDNYLMLLLGGPKFAVRLAA